MKDTVSGCFFLNTVYITLYLKKAAQLWNSISRRIDFDDIWQKYSEGSRIEFACFNFHVCLFVITLLSLKLHAENNACMLCASVSCWARLFLQHLRCRTLFYLQNWWSMDPLLTWNFSWLWGLSSSLSNSDSTVSTAHCVCRCTNACRLFWTSP